VIPLYTTIEGRKVPLISIGTSPFIGAGQFGVKGLLWRSRFLYNAPAMAELMMKSYEFGAKGAHIIPLGDIPKAVKLVRKEYPDFVVIGSTPPEGVEKGIKTLIDLDAEIIFVHGSIADSLRYELLDRYCRIIEEAGVISGVATHRPVHTVRYVENNCLCKAVLLPFNPVGYSMENRRLLEEIVDNSSLSFIAMKALAAGSVRPEEAFKYISQHNIKAVTVGLVSKEEAKETIHAALKYLKGDGGKAT